METSDSACAPNVSGGVDDDRRSFESVDEAGVSGREWVVSGGMGRGDEGS